MIVCVKKREMYSKDNERLYHDSNTNTNLAGYKAVILTQMCIQEKGFQVTAVLWLL